MGLLGAEGSCRRTKNMGDQRPIAASGVDGRLGGPKGIDVAIKSAWVDGLSAQRDWRTPVWLRLATHRTMPAVVLVLPISDGCLLTQWLASVGVVFCLRLCGVSNSRFNWHLQFTGGVVHWIRCQNVLVLQPHLKKTFWSAWVLWSFAFYLLNCKALRDLVPL